MRLEVSIVAERIELVDADAILLPVDGQICRLGGAVASGLRLALSPDERADEMDYVVDGAVASPDDCARMVRSAVPVAIALAAELQLASLAAPLIGTAYRMPPDLAIRAFADGLAAASKHPVHLQWSLPDPSYRQVARTAGERLGGARPA